MSRITQATVRVMRSHDYCHFEVVLTTVLPEPQYTDDSVKIVDELRKDAARLADKAVEQYKVKKLAMDKLDAVSSAFQLRRAEATPEGDRTPEEKAVIKYHSDKQFASQFDYNYQDDWREPEWD